VSLVTFRTIATVNKEANHFYQITGIVPRAHQAVLLALRPEAKGNAFRMEQGNDVLRTIDLKEEGSYRAGVPILVRTFQKHIYNPAIENLGQGNLFNRQITLRVSHLLFGLVNLVGRVADSILAIPAVPASILCTIVAPQADVTAKVNGFALRQLTAIGGILAWPPVYLGNILNPYPAR
jgi:hypothetical protein